MATSLGLYVCVYMYMYVYIYIYIHTYILLHIHTHIQASGGRSYGYLARVVCMGIVGVGVLWVRVKIMHGKPLFTAHNNPAAFETDMVLRYMRMYVGVCMPCGYMYVCVCERERVCVYIYIYIYIYL